MQLLLPAETSGNLIGSVHLADCLELCDRVYRAGIKVDCIAADLPYGTTSCAWDTIIPFDPMWKAFKRIIKPRGAIVLTASQPFTSALVMSNPKMFKCEWIWKKNWGSNFAVTDYQPMKEHESVIVFSDGTVNYYPQPMARNEAGVSRAKYPVNPTTNKRGFMGGYEETTIRIMNPENRVPSSVLSFNCERGLHPTQKPVELFRYLIRTYTLPDEIVFDPCVGSGTTADAAREEGRRFIVGDSSSEYVQVARNRLAQPYTPSFMPQLEAV